MTITLEAIKDRQDELAAMIAKFQSTTVRFFAVRGTRIQLHHGEHYAGLLLGKDGAPSAHLVLLPGEKESVTWSDAQAWARDAGGELPTRQEQALFYANLKDQFQPQWYWSSETHASASACAWSQIFTYGYQHCSDKSGLFRARAVRRLVIE